MRVRTQHADVSNLVNLEELSEGVAGIGSREHEGSPSLLAGAIVHQLRNRYARNHIYTAIGSILVSINPYKQLDIYTPCALVVCSASRSSRTCPAPKTPFRVTAAR